MLPPCLPQKERIIRFCHEKNKDIIGYMQSLTLIECSIYHLEINSITDFEIIIYQFEVEFNVAISISKYLIA